MEIKVNPPNSALFDSTFQEYVDRFDEQMVLMESINFDIPRGALLMMEANEKAVENAAKKALVFDKIVDLRRKKVGIQMRKLRLVFSTSGNRTKSDLEWMSILDRTIKILEAEIANFEAANPVDVEENFDEDNLYVENEPEETAELKEELTVDESSPSLQEKNEELQDPKSEEASDKTEDKTDSAFPSDDFITVKPDNDKKLARIDQCPSSDATEDLWFDLEEIEVQDDHQEETAEDNVDEKISDSTELEVTKVEFKQAAVQEALAAVQEQALATTMDDDVKKALAVSRDGFDAYKPEEVEIDETSFDAKATYPFDPGIDVDAQTTHK